MVLLTYREYLDGAMMPRQGKSTQDSTSQYYTTGYSVVSDRGLTESPDSCLRPLRGTFYGTIAEYTYGKSSDELSYCYWAYIVMYVHL